ncbi:MAG: hypothetical protein P8I55_06170 [Crocinitomix sp.]|nr:hypothetical protein [Crocinitomix sp.]
MTKREKYRFILLCFSGALYHLMSLMLPMHKGPSQNNGTFSYSYTLGASLTCAALYYLMLNKTT